MNYKILTISNNQEWQVYLKKLPLEQQDIYYTPEYYSLYENYGDGKAVCFVFEKDGEIALYPFLINSINQLGYELDKEYYDIQGAYGYNGVVSSSYDPAFIDEFYAAFDKFAVENNIVAEFTRFHPLLNNNTFSKKNHDVIFDRKTVYIDLTKPEEEIFSELQTTTRKQIRRCINRYKIKVVQKTKDISFLDSFMKIYQESMNRVHSIAYLQFNRDYFKELFINNNTIQLIALYQNEPIGIITVLVEGEYMHGHLGGTLTQYLNLSVYSLLYWEMIKTAKKMGLKHLHVGGGATSDRNDKLLEFKKHFSSHLADFYIGKKIHNPEIYDIIVNQWRQIHPDSYIEHQNKLLGYREKANG